MLIMLINNNYCCYERLKEGSIMPFCPICGSEYQAGFKKCSDCGAELTENLPAQKAVDQSAFYSDEPAYLTSGSTETDCSLIEGCLRTADIPFLKKDREYGSFMRVYMGYSVFGSDYYVPSTLLLKAKQAITEENSAENPIFNHREELSKNFTGHKKWRRIAALVIALIFIIGAYFVPVFFN